MKPDLMPFSWTLVWTGRWMALKPLKSFRKNSIFRSYSLLRILILPSLKGYSPSNLQTLAPNHLLMMTCGSHSDYRSIDYDKIIFIRVIFKNADKKTDTMLK